VDSSIVELAPFRWNGHQLVVRDQTIAIRRVTCPFGGERFLFVCGCGRQVLKLYSLSGAHFACRDCHCLTYASRKADLHERCRIKAQKIRARVGGGPSLLDPFPRRPRGMHRRTYARLLGKYDRAEQQSLTGLAQLASRLHDRVRHRRAAHWPHTMLAASSFTLAAVIWIEPPAGMRLWEFIFRQKVA